MLLVHRGPSRTGGTHLGSESEQLECGCVIAPGCHEGSSVATGVAFRFQETLTRGAEGSGSREHAARGPQSSENQGAIIPIAACTQKTLNNGNDHCTLLWKTLSWLPLTPRTEAGICVRSPSGLPQKEQSPLLSRALHLPCSLPTGPWHCPCGPANSFPSFTASSGGTF